MLSDIGQVPKLTHRPCAITDIFPDEEEGETSEDDPEGSRVRHPSVRDVHDRGEEVQGKKNGDADLAEETEFVLPHWTLRRRGVERPAGIRVRKEHAARPAGPLQRLVGWRFPARD